jgi:hypothetical protein
MKRAAVCGVLLCAGLASTGPGIETALGAAADAREQSAQTNPPLPSTPAKTLTGRAITLPGSDHAQTLLIVGFSKASSAAVKAWWLQAADLCKAHPAVACYKGAVLQDVPSFMRGMIVGGIKRDLSATEQDDFVTVVDNEAAWKQAFAFSAADNAYLAIVDRTGKVLWRATGEDKEANSAVIAHGFDSIPR